MQFATAIFTTLALALSARADSAICFPVPGQPQTVPQNVLDLDVSIKLNWATTLCSQLIYPSPTDQGNGLQIATTALSDGVLGSDGKLYGLEIVLKKDEYVLMCKNEKALHAIQTEDDCNINAKDMLSFPTCPGGGLLTLSGPLEQWSYITALN